MKKLLSLLILAIPCLLPSALPAQGLRYSENALANSSSITCAASAATNVAIVLDVRRQKSVTLQIEAYFNASSNAVNMGFPYLTSTDGVTYNTGVNLLIPFTGTTKQTVTTNLNLYGCGWIKFPFITNSDGNIGCTNLTFRAPLNYNSP